MNILQPLVEAFTSFEEIRDEEKQGRIFVFSGAEDSIRDTDVIHHAERAPMNLRVHTFGIGHDFSHYLLRGVAYSARGSFHQIGNLHSQRLLVEVKMALGYAMSDSLKDCSIEWMDFDNSRIDEDGGNFDIAQVVQEDKHTKPDVF